MSTTSPENVHRTDEVMPVVEVRRSKGVCHVKNLVIIAEFTPSHSHNSLQMFQSGPYGNQKKTHLSKFSLTNQQRLILEIKSLRRKIRRFIK